jgi:hypothetical protein
MVTKAAWRAFCVENPDALLLFIRLAIGTSSQKARCRAKTGFKGLFVKAKTRVCP